MEKSDNRRVSYVLTREGQPLEEDKRVIACGSSVARVLASGG